MLRSKKGAANVTLIALIVVAVVLAAALITTAVVLSKANDATEAKLADLSAKVDAQKYVTAAEVEAMIADIDLPEGVSKEYVAKEITAAINSYKTRDITPYVIQLMIDKAIAAIELPDGTPAAGLTEAQVKAIVDNAIADALKNVTPGTPAAGLTEAQVKAIVDNAVAALKNELSATAVTKAQMEQAIADALKNVTPGTGLTAAEVQVMISNAIAGIDTGLSYYEVQAMINAAIEAYKNSLQPETPVQPEQPAGSVEIDLMQGGEVTLTDDYTMTEWFSVREDAVLDLGGNTLTLDNAFYGMNVFGDVTIKNGYIETNRTAQLHTAPGGSMTLENVTIVSKTGVAAPITNNGNMVINNCQLINNNPSNNWMVSNGSIEHIEGGARYPGTMVISNTYIGGEYKTNEAVINNCCGTLTFGANVTINAIRPVEIEGGTPYYDIVESDPEFEVVPVTTGSVTINGVVVNF